MTIFLFSLSLSCCPWTSASATDASGFPDRVFAPYVDVLSWPTFSISRAFNETGQKYYTLAFIINQGQCTPSWGGVTPLANDWYKGEIDAIRADGGDVIISFGGANGTELALNCTSAAQLQQAYQDVIDRYQLKWIDFDIEGMAVADHPSIDRRNKVIKNLQTANPNLKVAFCLPVLPSGLDNNGLYVLQNAKANGVRIDLVNVMAMDYGDSTAPKPEGQMGAYAIQAATNTHNQLLKQGIDTKIGITPMIGQNDVNTEHFYETDAQELRDWSEAESQSWVGLLSMWSLGRDNGSCAPGTLSPSCSGISQKEFAFTNIFNGFGEGGQGNLPPSAVIVTPANNASFKLGADVTITAEANDSDGTITQVQFFQDSTSVGVVYQAPYVITLSHFATGTYRFTAVATDNSGATKTSRPVQIFVGNACRAAAWTATAVYVAGDVVSFAGHQWKAKWWTSGEAPGTSGQWGVWEDAGACGANAQNALPTVRITSPINNVSYKTGEEILLSAEAADSDGTIAKVEFFQDNVSLGSDTEAPFAIRLDGIAAPGNHTFKALATDNNGAVGTSAVVQVTINSATGGDGNGCSSYTAWDQNQNWTTYKIGDIRVNGGKLWKCTNPAYSYWEPSGSYGNFGWALIKSCN